MFPFISTVKSSSTAELLGKKDVFFFFLISANKQILMRFSSIDLFQVLNVKPTFVSDRKLVDLSTGLIFGLNEHSMDFFYFYLILSCRETAETFWTMSLSSCRHGKNKNKIASYDNYEM